MSRKHVLKFRDTWKNKRQIGKYYGKTPFEISTAFQDIGLESKIGGRPTQLAIESDLIKYIDTKNVLPYYLWHKKGIFAKLDEIPDWAEERRFANQLYSLTIKYVEQVNLYVNTNVENRDHHIKYQDLTETVNTVILMGNNAIEKVNQKLNQKVPREFFIIGSTSNKSL
jgi:hypothetical protein